MEKDFNWMKELEHLIESKHMLSHPFYKAWTCGHLPKATLLDYAKEYYHHVKAFPTYISAIHSRCEDMETRKCLLSNLIDEEAGEPNHPDLWKSFALAIGVTKEEIASHKAAPATKNLIANFRSCCSSSTIAEGVAALYCYESQIPSICQTKIEGLKKWYGMDQPEGYRYFSVHEVADIEHSHTEKKLLMSLVKPGEEKAVLRSAEKILNSLWDFLSSFKY